MKYSRQRELVRQAVEQSNLHPTADMVFQTVRQREPNISLATVYRNLNQLADHKMIRRIAVSGQSDHFDRTLTDHEHIICPKCGRVEDLMTDTSLLLHFQSMRPSITGYELILYGLCKDCENQTKE